MTFCDSFIGYKSSSPPPILILIFAAIITLILTLSTTLVSTHVYDFNDDPNRTYFC